MSIYEEHEKFINKEGSVLSYLYVDVLQDPGKARGCHMNTFVIN